MKEDTGRGGGGRDRAWTPHAATPGAAGPHEEHRRQRRAPDLAEDPGGAVFVKQLDKGTAMQRN